MSQSKCGLGRRRQNQLRHRSALLYHALYRHELANTIFFGCASNSEKSQLFLIAPLSLLRAYAVISYRFRRSLFTRTTWCTFRYFTHPVASHSSLKRSQALSVMLPVRLACVNAFRLCVAIFVSRNQTSSRSNSCLLNRVTYIFH